MLNDFVTSTANESFEIFWSVGIGPAMIAINCNRLHTHDIIYNHVGY